LFLSIRVWDLPTATCKLVLKAKAVSCLAFCAAANVFAAGFHDVGRTQVWSSVTWQPLQTLGGHLHGIRAIDINERYLVSAGADKGKSLVLQRSRVESGMLIKRLVPPTSAAIVVTDWRTGVKVTRFGQQTNVNIGVQLIGDGDRIVSVTLDGIIRCFSICKRRAVCPSLERQELIYDPLPCH
jgi:pyrimidine and pyridine-specific 5'-nucleotidase